MHSVFSYVFCHFSGGISTIENQSAIQSILESQTGNENASTQGRSTVSMWSGLKERDNVTGMQSLAN